MRTAPALTLAVAAGLNPLAYGFDVSLVDWATTVLDTGLPAGGVYIPATRTCWLVNKTNTEWVYKNG